VSGSDAQRTVCIIQARMGSSRLPGKVLEPLLSQPMLWWDVTRVRACRQVEEIVVATTTLPADDVIARFCEQQGFSCFRGSEDDVLDRYYQAALFFEADRVVRVTSDCPLIEPSIIDAMLARFAEETALDYLSNTIAPRTFPRGLDAEVFTVTALAEAWRGDDNPAWREHVTPFLYRHSETFRLGCFAQETDDSEMRWTVDTAEDLAFVRRIYDHFGRGDFSWRDVLAVLETHPEWQQINQHVVQRQVA